MKKTILLFAAVLLANVSFSQSLYSELTNWMGDTYCNGKTLPPNSCPSYDNLCVNDFVPAGSCSTGDRWLRIGTPHKLFLPNGTPLGLGLWSSGGDCEGIFTDFAFTPGTTYQIKVGVYGFNKLGTTSTKLRLFAATDLHQSTQYPCCAEPLLEDASNPNNVDMYWMTNINSPNPNPQIPQIEYIGDIMPASIISGATTDFIVTYTPTSPNQQFVIYAHDLEGSQLEVELDYIEITSNCDATEWFYSGNTQTPYDIDFQISSPNGMTYDWTLCDGGTSNNTSFMHSYSGPGGYHVCLAQDYSNGTSCELCRDICLSEPNVSDYDGVLPTSSCTPPHFAYSVYASNTQNFQITPLGNINDLVDIDFGDGTVLYGQNQQSSYIHNYMNPGSYTVCVTIPGLDPCQVCMDICIEIPAGNGTSGGGSNSKPARTTSLQDNNMSRGFGIIDIVPNPASDHVSVNVAVGQSDANTVAVTFYDMTGKKVLEYEHAVVPGSNALDIDISELNSGMYILNVQNGTNTVKSKVIKQ